MTTTTKCPANLPGCDGFVMCADSFDLDTYPCGHRPASQIGLGCGVDADVIGDEAFDRQRDEQLNGGVEE